MYGNYDSSYVPFGKRQPAVNQYGQRAPSEMYSRASSNYEKSQEHQVEVLNSYYSEKVDHSGSGYLHPILSANRSQLMALFAGIAALLLLISTVLLWIIHSKLRRDFTLWIAITWSVLVICSLAIAAIGMLTKRHVLQDTPENKLLTMLAYVLSTSGAAIVITSVLILLLYRWPVFNLLLLKKTDGFEQSWKTSKLMLWWTCLFNLIGGILLAMCSFLMWSVSKFMIELARAALAIAGGLATIFFVASGYNLFKGYDRYLDHHSVQELYTKTDWRPVEWLMYSLIVLLIANLIFNIFKKRVIYFVMGIIFLMIAVAFSVKVAYNLRVIRKSLEPGNSVTDSSLADLATFNKEDFSSVCNKYSDAESCSKVYNTVRFEDDNQKASLDPACARNIRTEILNTFYLAAVFGLFGIGLTAVVISCDFYLSDTSEFLEIYNNKRSVYEFLGLAIALAALIVGLILYWTSSFKPIRENRRASQDIYSKLQAGTYQDLDWNIIPSSVLSKSRQANTSCASFDPDTMVKVADQDNCPAGTRCGYRMFILAEDIQFTNIIKQPLPNQNTRVIAYPEARNSADGFLFVVGTSTDLNEILKNLKLCRVKYNDDASLFFKIEVVNLDALDNQGLKAGESVQDPGLDQSGTRGFPVGFVQGTNLTCKTSSSCNLEYVINKPTGIVRITGEFYGKNTSGVYAPMAKEVLENIVITGYHGPTLYTSTDAQSILDNGKFYFDVPSSTNTPYVLTMQISHKDKLLVDLKKEIIVPAIPNSQIPVGKIALIVPSGIGCIGSTDVIECLRNQQTAGRGKLIAIIKNSDTNQLVKDAFVRIYSGQLVTVNQEFGGQETNSNGETEFSDLKYDYYTLAVNGPGYVQQVKTVVLDTTQTTLTIYITPEAKTAMDVSIMIENAFTEDTDLKLRIRHQNGKECLVSSENKYCAYSFYIHDVTSGNSGIETIRVHNLTNAYYMVFTQTMFDTASDLTCKAYNNAATHFSGLSKLDWQAVVAKSSDNTHAQASKGQLKASDPGVPRVGHVQATKTKPYWLAYCFTGYGQQSLKVVNTLSSQPPSFQDCMRLYPDSDIYSLANLAKEPKASN